MVNIIKQEILIDESLKKKLKFICDFCNTTPIFINERIRKALNLLYQHLLIFKNTIKIVHYHHQLQMNRI